MAAVRFVVVKLSLAGTLLLPWTSSGQLFGSKPQTYEDCILEGMKGVTSDVAARAIMAACLKKFPDAAPSVRAPSRTPLPQSEVSLITIEVAVDRSARSRIYVNVHNGTRSWNVERMVLSATPQAGTKGLSPKQFALDTELAYGVRPLETKQTSYEFGGTFDATKYVYSLVEADGTPRR